jgi:dihydrofolate reductase
VALRPRELQGAPQRGRRRAKRGLGRRTRDLRRHGRNGHGSQCGTSFTFVTDGVESAVEQAKAAAGDKDVNVAGGADVIQKALAAGLLEELQIHFAPLLLGGGTRLFGKGDLQRLECMRVIESPAVTHVKYRVVKA